MHVRIILLIFLVFTHNSWALELTFRKSKTETQKIEIMDRDGLNVNQRCVELKGKCIALNPQKQKDTHYILKYFNSHPAAQNCLEYQGSPIILKDDKKNEYDYCLFHDQSMVNSWDLYNKIEQEK